jgi:hypothetical protein
VRVIGRHEQSVLALPDELRYADDAGAHDRQASAHRLDQDYGKPVAVAVSRDPGGDRHRGAMRVRVAHLVGAARAPEIHAVLHAQRRGKLSELGQQGAVADHLHRERLAIGGRQRTCLHERVNALLRNQPCYGEHRRVRNGSRLLGDRRNQH